MKKLLKKTAILSVTSLMLLGATSAHNTISQTHALYSSTNQLVGHGFDALSTKNGLNTPDKGTISLPLITGLGDPTLEDWKGSFSISDQNGDSKDSKLTLYPGETFHIHYTIKYTADSTVNSVKFPVDYLGSEEFMSFRSDFFNYTSQPKLIASNANTNPTLQSEKIIDKSGRTKTQLRFSATQIQPGDEFTVDFDLQTTLDLKEKVIADRGTFPSYYTISSMLEVYDGGFLTYVRGLGWTQTEATSSINKKHIEGNTHQVEITNTTKGSIFNQIIHNSMLMDATNITITNLEQIHTAKNPFVDYVDLAMNKGTQITTNGTASQAQLDLINAQLQAGNFVIDEIQEGDKVVVTYQTL